MKKNLVIITSWNDNLNSFECVNSLKKEKKKIFDICLVDNNSKIKNFLKLKNFLKKFSKINGYKFIELKSFEYSRNNDRNVKKLFLIRSPINTGCTGGYNIGYDFAINQNYEYVFRLDNDCIVEKNFLSHNVNFLEKNKDYAGVNSKVCYKHLKNRIQWVGVKINFKFAFHRSIRIFNKPKNIYEINEHVHTKNWKGVIITDSLNGPGSTIRVSCLKKSGISDPEFFFGPEDIDLSSRLKKVGKLAVNLNSTIYHSVAQSASLTGINFRKYYEIKSHLLILKKMSTKYYVIGSIYNFSRIFFFSLITLLKPNNINYTKLKILLSANKDFYLGNLGVFDLKKNNKNKEKNCDYYLKQVLKY